MSIEFERKAIQSKYVDTTFIDERINEAFKILNDAIEGLKGDLDKDYLDAFRLSFWCGDAGMAYGIMATVMRMAEIAGLKEAYRDKNRQFVDLYTKFWKLRDEFIRRL